MSCSSFVAALAALPICAAAATAQPSIYAFSIDPAASGLAANLLIWTQSSGTMIGNWDPDTNPTGTRTKPGINPLVPFGATENLPVATQLGTNLGGPINPSTSGEFVMSIDVTAGVVQMAEFSANFLSSGPVDLPLTLSLMYEGFRTRNPSSTFLAPPFPVDIPFGQATLSAMTVEQVGPGSPGVVTPNGDGTYAFLVAPVVTLTAVFSFLGTEFAIPGLPVAFPLGGTLTLNGDLAEILSVQPLGFTDTVNPGLALPEFPLDLPTILPPGDTAHLLLNLMLDELGSTLEGTQTLSASGVLVPGPGTAAAALLGLGLLASRRRR